MTRLLHSAKFWTAVIAGVFNIVGFVVAHYYPTYNDMFTVVIASLDGVFAVVIGSIAFEDAAAKNAMKTQRYIEEQHLVSDEATEIIEPKA